jgi:hypothetical protein
VASETVLRAEPTHVCGLRDHFRGGQRTDARQREHARSEDADLGSDAALELVCRDREFADPGHEVHWDDGAGLAEYADAVVDAIADAKDLVLVAQSFGGFTAPLVCERVPVDLLVLVAAMILVPVEAASGYWANTQ